MSKNAHSPKSSLLSLYQCNGDYCLTIESVIVDLQTGFDQTLCLIAADMSKT
jgi:hypothetical protein